MTQSSRETQQGSYSLLVVAVILSLVIVGADANSPGDLSLLVFNIVPVVMVAWFVGSRPAYVLAIGCGIGHVLGDKITGRSYTLAYIPYVQAAVKVPLFLAAAYLVSRFRQALAREKQRARTDSLTGLLNSGTFTELVELEIARSRRIRQSFSLVYMDIDNFKSVNDTRGHIVGDAVLRTVSHTIVSHIREMDSAGRMGGDEIAILLPETDHDLARQVISRVRSALNEAVEENNWPVTFSVGVVTWDAAPDDATTAIREVDQAMYSVKQAGKSDVQFLILQRQKP